MRLNLKGTTIAIEDWHIPQATELKLLTQMPGFNPPFASHIEFADQNDCEQKVIEWALTFAQTKMGVFPLNRVIPSKNLIGVAGLKPAMKKEGMQFEVMLRIPDVYWTPELYRESMNLLTGYAFKTIGLKEVITAVDTDDQSKQRILQEFGFEPWKTEQHKSHEFLLYRLKADSLNN